MSLQMTPIHPPSRLHTPPSRSARPSRPVLKLPLPLNPWNPSPAPSDLTVLIADALKADPSPRRNQPNYFFTQTTNAPKPPPPTPVIGSPDDPIGTPLSELDGMNTPGSRASIDTQRTGTSVKSVRFAEEVCDSLENEKREGRVWKD